MNIPIDTVNVLITILATALGGLVTLLIRSLNRNTDAITSIHQWMSAKDATDNLNSTNTKDRLDGIDDRLDKVGDNQLKIISDVERIKIILKIESDEK